MLVTYPRDGLRYRIFRSFLRPLPFNIHLVALLYCYGIKKRPSHGVRPCLAIMPVGFLILTGRTLEPFSNKTSFSEAWPSQRFLKPRAEISLLRCPRVFVASRGPEFRLGGSTAETSSSDVSTNCLRGSSTATPSSKASVSPTS